MSRVTPPGFRQVKLLLTDREIADIDAVCGPKRRQAWMRIILREAAKKGVDEGVPS